jgi:biotin transport system substrate-specific component
MTQAVLTCPTLIATVWDTRAATRAARLRRDITLAFAATVVLALSARLEVPFYPVPMTMQTYVVVVTGMVFGARLGALAVLAYLAEGALGIPVFAGTPEKGIGLAYMMGGTGGYLVGFVVAAGLCGWLAERGWDRSVGRCALAMICAHLVIYTLGLAWLGTLFGWDKPILQWGLYPFVLGDLVKVALATVTLPLLWRVLGRHRGRI